jgi:hypothetical protein
MGQRGVVAFGVLEGLERWHLHEVRGDVVVGTTAAIPDVGVCVAEECFGKGDPGYGIEHRRSGCAAGIRSSDWMYENSPLWSENRPRIAVPHQSGSEVNHVNPSSASGFQQTARGVIIGRERGGGFVCDLTLYQHRYQQSGLVGVTCSDTG